MVKAVGFIEIITAVTTEFDAELRARFPDEGKYISTAKWNEKPTKYTSYRQMSPLLTRVEARLKTKFKKPADELDLNFGKSILTKFYGQPQQQMVAYVTGLLITVIAESPDAKIV